MNKTEDNYYYNQVYGQTFVLPALNFNTLLTSGGSNDNDAPNLYWYQSTDTGTTPVTYIYSGSTSLTYSTDTGCQSFFNSITQQTNSLGGSIQWVNGTL